MKDLTKGSLAKHLTNMAVPIGVGMLAQTMYFLVDLYFVGKLGSNALAGVSAAGNLNFFILATTQAVSIGSISIISVAFGKKDIPSANMAFNQTLILSTLLFLLTLFFGYILAPSYLSVVSSDKMTIQSGTSYLYWFIPSLGLQFLLVGMSSGLRASGIVKPTMIIQLISVIMNIILTPILVTGWYFGITLGVVGAGLSSSISTLAGVILMSIYFRLADTSLKFNLKSLRPDPIIWKKIALIGLPASGEYLVTFLYMVVIFWALQVIGPSVQAGFALSSRIMQAIFMPTLAIAYALPAIVGQNLGAKEYKRVTLVFNHAMRVIAIIMIILMLICLTFTDVLVKPFAPDKEVLLISVVFIQIISLNFIPSGVIFACSGMCQGLGNTWPAFYSMAARLFLFSIPAIWLSQQSYFKFEHICYLSVVTAIIQSLLSYSLVKREMNKKLVSDRHDALTIA